MTLPKPITRIRNKRTHDLGTLVRIGPTGEPVVRYFGDRLEYPCSWGAIDVISSTEYSVPTAGDFHAGLWVTVAGDVFREVVEPGSDWPCTDGAAQHDWVETFPYLSSPTRTRVKCTNCGVRQQSVLRFALIATSGQPAMAARSQTRHEIERYSGAVLLPAGSAQAHAARPELNEQPPIPVHRKLGALFLLLCACLLVWWITLWVI